jgi:Winged helix-turn helix
MAVISMSDRELIRLPMMIDVVDGRLTVAAAAVLLGLSRRQVFRLRHAVTAEGPAGLTSYRCGRPSNRRRSKTFRRTVLALVRGHYAGFDPIARFAGSLIAAASNLEMRQQCGIM